MTVQTLRALAIHCQRCQGRGTALQIASEAIVKAECPQCAGTGLRSPDDASSAQPHRFSMDHPMLVVSSEPQDHPAAD